MANRTVMMTMVLMRATLLCRVTEAALELLVVS